jgi:hypothetical protein
MTQDEVHARHLVELGYLEQIAAEMGYPARLEPKSKEVPYHMLLLGLEPDAKGRPMEMTLTFYPVGDDDVENTMLLQYYVELPMEVDRPGLSRVRELLPDINNQVVLGHFSISDSQNRLHYRYVQALRADQLVSAAAVTDVMTITSYTPAAFEDILEALAKDEISVEQARAQLDARYAQG